MAGFVVDGLEIGVLVGTWRMTFPVAGSRAVTETNIVRSVRSGDARVEMSGTAIFETRTEADTALDLLLTAGDHAVSGELPGAAYTCEAEVGTMEAIDHRPPSGPTAKWKFDFRMIGVVP